MKAPTRALIVEDIESWRYNLKRAARRAGASEVVVCENLQEVKEALRKARFDIAILDVGLDPDDDLNSDGIDALEAIREIDGMGTRCILITGWQGGDRMDLQARTQQKFGIDWAYMKENYEAHAVIDKLSELLEDASLRRLSLTTPMANLGAEVEPFRFEAQLLGALSPTGGVQTLYSLVSRLLSSAIPVIAMYPTTPMRQEPDGIWMGVYWSRALAAAVAVDLALAAGRKGEEGSAPAGLLDLLSAGETPDLIESVRERNIQARLWEIPLDRDRFPG